MDRVDPGHHLPVNTGSANDQTPVVTGGNFHGFLLTVDDSCPGNADVLPGQDQILPSLQRLPAGEILHRAAPDQHGGSCGQLTKMLPVCRQDNLLRAF